MKDKIHRAIEKSLYAICGAVMAIILGGAGIAFASSFGTLNFFYAPGNVITPLPGYTMSLGNSAGVGNGTILWTIGTTTGLGNSLTFTSAGMTYPALTLGTTGNVGIGSTSPDALLSLMDTSGYAAVAPHLQFEIGSSTGGGTATTTNFSVSSTGSTTLGGLTSTTANLTIGPRSSSAIQIVASSTGTLGSVALYGFGTNGFSALDTIDTSAHVRLNILGAAKLECTSVACTHSDSQSIFTPSTGSTAANTHFLFTGPADTSLTAGTEAMEEYFNNSASRQHTGGSSIATQRDFRIAGGTHTFSTFDLANNNFGRLDAVEIDGPSTLGVNATASTSVALDIGTAALNASTTIAIGLAVKTPTGAGSNYAASTTGRVVMSALGNDGADVATLCVNSAGEVLAHTTTGCITSSQRFKDNIEVANEATGFSEIMSLVPKTFTYKPGQGPPGQQIGFIAEDVMNVDPRLVPLDSQGLPFTVNYQQLTAPIVSAVQFVEGQITGMLSRLNWDEKRIDAMQAQINQLEVLVNSCHQ